MPACAGKKSKLAALLAGAFALSFHCVAIGGDRLRLAGHVPQERISHSRHIGRLASRAPVNLAFSLKPRDPAGLNDLLKRLYDPSEPDYGHFLSPAEFKARFAPTDADVADILTYLRANGFRNASAHANNLVIDAVADAGVVERTFQVELHEYIAENGARVRAPLENPEVNGQIASRLHGITGLNTFRHSHAHVVHRGAALSANSLAGVNSYMTPPKIKNAYDLSLSSTAGAGETIALFELDGFNPSDLAVYENYFSITPPTVNTVLVDGASGTPGADADEVTLDIELVAGVSPGAAITVYEGPNTDAGVLDTYNRIASDNTAKIVSTSWGSSENGETQSFLNSENSIFQQMAAQGQSVFAASGDSGAYDDTGNPSLLTVDDPSSQPYVTSVGGTTLNLTLGSYGAESSWGTSASGMGSGGGFSAVWSMPSWQAGLADVANKGSNSKRMVPDVALDANPATGYSIYVAGAWYAIGGTSAAAPLWAAFTAQVNQARLSANLSRLGFASPSIYQVAQSSLRSSCFHDVADGSTNLFYPANVGYDLSTGWGSPKGSALLAALSAASLPPSPPANVATSGAAGTVTISWSAASGANSYTVYRSAAFSGPYVSRATLAGTSFSENVGSGGFYYYVTATNSAGTGGASAKRAGAAPLAAPGATSDLSSAGGQ